MWWKYEKEKSKGSRGRRNVPSVLIIHIHSIDVKSSYIFLRIYTTYRNIYIYVCVFKYKKFLFYLCKYITIYSGYMHWGTYDHIFYPLFLFSLHIVSRYLSVFIYFIDLTYFYLINLTRWYGFKLFPDKIKCSRSFTIEIYEFSLKREISHIFFLANVKLSNFLLYYNIRKEMCNVYIPLLLTALPLTWDCYSLFSLRESADHLTLWNIQRSS